MLKKIFRGLAGKLVKDPLVRDAIAAMADDVVTSIADKHTGGIASKVDQLIKRRKAKRRAHTDR